MLGAALWKAEARAVTLTRIHPRVARRVLLGEEIPIWRGHTVLQEAGTSREVCLANGALRPHVADAGGNPCLICQRDGTTGVRLVKCKDLRGADSRDDRDRALCSQVECVVLLQVTGSKRVLVAGPDP